MLILIADDLTGAFDSAAPFAARGMPTVVALHPAALTEALATGAQVVAVTTQSREIAADAAAARVAAVASALPAGVRVFKKVDSRLKGHVAAELAALSPASMLVAPAIPDFGRVVRDGAVTGFGVEVPIPVRDALGDLAARAIVPDTETAKAMEAALAAAPDDALLVGARGLAEALAQRLSGRSPAEAPRPKADRVLMVVGSRDPITLAQVAALRAGGADWRAAPNGRLADLRPVERLTLVQATPGVDRATGADVAQALSAAVHPALTAGAGAVFLTGGATAEAVMQAMGLNTLRLVGEVLPGVPLGLAADGQMVIVKSGGFGGKDTLTRLSAILGGA